MKADQFIAEFTKAIARQNSPRRAAILRRRYSVQCKSKTNGRRQDVFASCQGIPGMGSVTSFEVLWPWRSGQRRQHAKFVID